MIVARYPVDLIDEEVPTTIFGICPNCDIEPFFFYLFLNYIQSFRIAHFEVTGSRSISGITVFRYDLSEYLCVFYFLYTSSKRKHLGSRRESVGEKCQIRGASISICINDIIDMR